jgi:hypothetical protein
MNYINAALEDLQVSTGSAVAMILPVFIPWPQADWDFKQNMYPMLRHAKTKK